MQVQRRLLDGYELVSSFGRAPAKFRLAPAASGAAGTAVATGGALLGQRPQFDRATPCFAVCALQNLSSRAMIAISKMLPICWQRCPLAFHGKIPGTEVRVVQQMTTDGRPVA